MMSQRKTLLASVLDDDRCWLGWLITEENITTLHLTSRLVSCNNLLDSSSYAYDLIH